MRTTHFALACLGASLFTVQSFAQAPSTTTTVVTQEKVPEATSAEVGVSSRDGITISGTSVLITRNGTTETLSKELELSNGMRVRPDGTITTADGGKLTLRSTQVLTFDGKVIESSPATAAPATPSVTTTTVTTAPNTTPVPATVVTQTPPTIVIQKPAVTPQAAEEAAAVEAKRRAESVNKGPIKAGEGVQK